MQEAHHGGAPSAFCALCKVRVMIGEGGLA